MATSKDLRAAIDEVRRAARPRGGRADLEEALARVKRRWAGKLGERLAGLPWWMVSTIIHGGLVAPR